MAKEKPRINPSCMICHEHNSWNLELDETLDTYVIYLDRSYG